MYYERTQPQQHVLPDFLLVKILEFLPIKSLGAVSLVCHEWRFLAEKFIWKFLVHRRWNASKSHTHTDDEEEGVKSWNQCKFCVTSGLYYYY